MAPSASHPTTTTLDGGPVAVIAGSSFLQSAHHWLGDGACLSRDVTTPFGDVAVTCATIAAVGVVFVQRHRCTADRAYRIPTRINFQAIWWALKHHFVRGGIAMTSRPEHNAVSVERRGRRRDRVGGQPATRHSRRVARRPRRLLLALPHRLDERGRIVARRPRVPHRASATAAVLDDAIGGGQRHPRR